MLGSILGPTYFGKLPVLVVYSKGFLNDRMK